MSISSRKDEHLRLCFDGDVEFQRTTGLEAVHLAHRALPEVSADEVDLSCELFGVTLAAPVLVAAMTGGTKLGKEVNEDLAWAVRSRGLALGLGSQRPMVEDETTTPTFQVEGGAQMLVLGNLGLYQARHLEPSRLDDLVSAVGAQALCLHLNTAQELAQPEGDRDFRGGLETLTRLACEMTTPLVVKETGCGIGRDTAVALAKTGVRHVDVAGVGGTSWVKVERLRKGATVAGPFDEWGLATADCVRQVAPLGFETVIASGGIRTGLDAAKALALGAHAVAIALPVLRAWHKGGRDHVAAYLDTILDELRNACVLTGSRTRADLQGALLP